MNDLIKKLLSKNGKILITLFFICLISYYPVFNSEYLTFDDTTGILNSKLITQPFTIDSLSKIFTSFQENQYTPLSTFTFWVEYNLLLDFNSSLSHLTNFIIHLLGVFALYFLARDLFDNAKFAFFLTILWAIHPIQVASVAWVTGRRTLLYGSFFILSLMFYTKYVTLKKQNKLYYYLTIIAMILSCLSKALAFTIPIVCLFIDLLKNRKINNKLILEKTTIFIIAILFFVTMFVSANTGIRKNSNKNIKLNYKQSAFSIVYYFYKTIFPCDLSATNELNTKSEDLIENTYLYFIPFIFLMIAISLKSKYSLFGLLFYLIHIIPLSGLIRVGYSFIISYHYCYIPLLGLLIIIVDSIRIFLNKINFKNKTSTCLFISFFILSILVTKTVKFCEVYKNTETLYLNSLRINEYDTFARVNLINYYISLNQFEKAKSQSYSFISINPKHSKPFVFLAHVEICGNNLKKAIKLLERAMSFKPEDTQIYYYLGFCYSKLRNWYDAERFFSKYLNSYRYQAIYIKSTVISCFSLRALACQKIGKYSLAEEDYAQVSFLDPLNFENKVKSFQNSMQMMNYYKSMIKLTDIYGYIDSNLDETIDVKLFYSVMFFPSTKEFLKKCLPFYSYLNNLIYNKPIILK